MNYEKRYIEAFNEAAIAYKDEDKHLKATLERIFPELKETEEKPNGGIVLEDFNEGDGFYTFRVR